MPLKGRNEASVEVAIGLGSNLGDRSSHIDRAIRAFDALDGVVVSKVAPLYETEPWGKTDQPRFLNTCIKAQTTLPPEEVLTACLDIEKEMGRERIEKWGPRLIDLDVLLYDDQSIDMPGLTVPHPHITERAFVLLPLADVWPDAMIAGVRVGDIADRYRQSPDIWRFDPLGNAVV